MKREVPSGLILSLADGAGWLIRAGDAQAEQIVSALGTAMRLQRGSTGRQLLAVVRKEGGMAPVNLAGPGPALCVLSPPSDDDLLAAGMSRLASAIAREAQSRGGLLLHGALAEAPSPLSESAIATLPSANAVLQHEHGTAPDSGSAGGILLAGPGTVGKSTASRRLPPPWRSLSDDAALIVRDPQGRYLAHPWPTWSRFFRYGVAPPPGGSWDVRHAVPLRAIFFLSQSPEDRVETLSETQSTAMLMEAVQHVSRPMTYHLSEDQAQALYREQLAAAEALARTIPTHVLHLSLTGAFWEEIERVLAETPSPRPSPRGGEGVISPVQEKTARARRASLAPLSLAGRGAGGEGRTTTKSPLEGGSLHVAYTGASMSPTLIEPELLQVMPYRGRPVRAGDVVYFRPRGEQVELVHRVIAVTSSGVAPGSILTRGDSNPSADPYLLLPGDVIGRVVAAQRGARCRRIAGGLSGVLVGTTTRIWCLFDRSIAKLLHGDYRALARTGFFRNLLPAKLRPRVFVFRSRQRPFFKLMMAGRVVGRFDTREQRWHIRRPFRLFVDETALPRPEAGQDPVLHREPIIGQAD